MRPADIERFQPTCPMSQFLRLWLRHQKQWFRRHRLKSCEFQDLMLTRAQSSCNLSPHMIHWLSSRHRRERSMIDEVWEYSYESVERLWWPIRLIRRRLSFLGFPVLHSTKSTKANIGIYTVENRIFLQFTDTGMTSVNAFFTAKLGIFTVYRYGWRSVNTPIIKGCSAFGIASVEVACGLRPG